jgi:hypothetical protein
VDGRAAVPGAVVGGAEVVVGGRVVVVGGRVVVVGGRVVVVGGRVVVVARGVVVTDGVVFVVADTCRRSKYVVGGAVDEELAGTGNWSGNVRSAGLIAQAPPALRAQTRTATEDGNAGTGIFSS